MWHKLYSQIHILNAEMLSEGLEQANNTKRMLRKWAVKLSKLLSIDVILNYTTNDIFHGKHYTEPKDNEQIKSENQQNGHGSLCVICYPLIIKCVCLCVSIHVIKYLGMQCDLWFSIILGHLKCESLYLRVSTRFGKYYALIYLALS